VSDERRRKDIRRLNGPGKDSTGQALSPLEGMRLQQESLMVAFGHIVNS
jgi:hypothetical protein